MTKIYVGNLPFSASESEVRELFAQHGTVESVSLITDRDTGRPRGFGFVEMARADASRAIQNLNGKDLGGRPLRVNEAQERTGGGGGADATAVDGAAAARSAGKQPISRPALSGAGLFHWRKSLPAIRAASPVTGFIPRPRERPWAAQLFAFARRTAWRHR